MQAGARLRRGGATTIVVCLALLGALALPAGASAAGNMVQVVTGGVLEAADDDQTGRLALDGTASTCGGAITTPTVDPATGARAYDPYPHTNLTNDTICFTVEVDPAGTSCFDNQIYNVTYLGSFDPSDLQNNYLADPGSPASAIGTPASESFNIAPGQTFVDVVHAVDADEFCSGYTYKLISQKPFAFTLPTTVGTAAVGSTLGWNVGQWTAPANFSYQWRRCDTAGANCADIPGANSGLYAPTGSDVGSTLRIRVIVSDGVDSSSADSAPTAVVAPAPPPTTTQQGTGGKGSAKAKKCKKKKKSSASAAKKKKCKKKKR